MLDFEKIKSAAQSYEKDMTAFLRAIVKNPGESCDEKAHIDTIAAEMKKIMDFRCYEVLGNGKSADTDVVLAMPVKNKDGKRADAGQESPKEENRKPKPGRKMRF